MGNLYASKKKGSTLSTSYAIRPERYLANGKHSSSTSLSPPPSTEEQVNKHNAVSWLPDMDEAQQDFVANLSHEIRNPLNAVVGMADLLSDTPLQDRQREYLEALQHASGVLLSLVDRLLNLSSPKKQAINPQVFDLEDLIVQVARTLEFSLSGRPVRLELYYEAGLPSQVMGDPTAVNQILFNLLSNALKFTREGFIGISVVRHKGQLQLQISDSGPGIPTEELPGIFDRHNKSNQRTSSQYGGSGLGLSITRKLVEALGGNIEVESQLGKGTEFRVLLPLIHAPESDRNKGEKKRQIRNLAGLRVLIVEDSSFNRKYLEELCRRWKISFHSCALPEEALRLLQEYSFDLALLDLQLPGLGGPELAHRIQELAPYPLSILALTGNTRPEEHARALKSGVDRVLVKPFTPKKLWEELLALCSNSSLAMAFDHRILEELYGGDLHHARLMFELFMRNTPGEINRMEICLQNNDIEQLKGLIHKIKPTFGMVGFHQLEGMADQLEKVACTQPSDAKLSSLFERFRQHITEALDCLAREIHQLDLR